MGHSFLTLPRNQKYVILFGVSTLRPFKVASVDTFAGSVLKGHYILRTEELCLPLRMFDAGVSECWLYMLTDSWRVSSLGYYPMYWWMPSECQAYEVSVGALASSSIPRGICGVEGMGLEVFAESVHELF